jgi:protein translocase subunit secB
VFGIAGLDPQMVDGLLGTQCPNILFPYIRQLLSDLIQAGGFPPFFLQPINFRPACMPKPCASVPPRPKVASWPTRKRRATPDIFSPLSLWHLKGVQGERVAEEPAPECFSRGPGERLPLALSARRGTQ